MLTRGKISHKGRLFEMSFAENQRMLTFSSFNAAAVLSCKKDLNRLV